METGVSSRAMSPRLAPCVLLACVACASTRGTTTARPRRTRFVLVERAGVLRTRPSPDAPALSVTHDAALAFRRVGVRGDWVELETVTAPERHCAESLVAPAGVRLRLFAPTFALVPVVSHAARVSGPEGTYTLGVGLPVRESDDRSSVEIAHAGLRVNVTALPETARVYGPAFAEPPRERAERLRPGTRATLPNGAFIEVERDPPVYVLVRNPSAQGARVVVSTPCVWFDANVPSESVLPTMEVEVPERASVRLPRWVVRAGARLSWPDGSPAGRTTAAVTVTDEGRTDGARRCVHVPLRLSRSVGERASSDVEVCASADDVQVAGGV
jgi:hypothetical protein